MQPLLVCGNANVETVLRVPADGLPPEGGYFPHTLSLSVGGVGANLVRALTQLGSPVRWLTLVAEDTAGALIRASCAGVEVRSLPTSATPQSLALLNPDGSHTFYRDLKDTAESPVSPDLLTNWLPDCVAALITNIGWTRELLPVVKAAGVPILTDVQDIRTLDNPYDAPYFAAADVLFFSAAHLPNPLRSVQDLARQIPAQVIVAGLGEQGALLLERGQLPYHQPPFAVQAAFQGGAGDTLAATFAHFYFTRGHPAREALRLACAGAAFKLQTLGSGAGHASEAELLAFAN